MLARDYSASVAATQDALRPGLGRGRFLALMVGTPTILYGIMSLSLRDAGQAPLLAAVACAFASIILLRVRPIELDYAPFLFFSSCILSLSLLSVMPSSWTFHRSASDAFRQWFFVPVLPILIAYFSEIAVSFDEFIRKHIWTIFVIAFLMSRASQVLHGGYQAKTDLFMYTFTNDVAFLSIIFVLALFKKKRPMLIDLSLIASMFFMCSSSQSQLFWLIVAAIRVTAWPRLALFGVIALCVLFIGVIAPSNVVALHDLDHNTGVRAILWRDVQEAIVDTWGVGVGYGTEYIKNRFEEVMPWGWVIGNGADDVFVATHSSFYDVLLREGVFGLLLFGFWYARSIRVSGDLSLHDTRAACAIAALLVVNSAVNVGLSSIGFLFGSAFALAFLRAFRSRSTSWSA